MDIRLTNRLLALALIAAYLPGIARGAETGPATPGGATAAKQPVLNGDGGALSHVTNFPVSYGVVQSGATPADYSANAVAAPLSGYVLVSTIPATSSRANVEVVNLSGATVQLVLDDGAATTGTISSVLLAGGAGTPSQGGAWSDQAFKGRVRVYAPSSAAIVTARQE